MHLPNAPAKKLDQFTSAFFRPGLRVRSAPVMLAFLLVASIGFAGNKALKLDGRGSYVELPPNIFRDLTQATVEVWAKWTAFENYSRIFEFGAGWQSMSVFNHASTPDLRFNLYPRSARNDPSLMYSVRVPGLLRSNEWIHIAAVSGSRGMKLYANGVLVGQHTNGASFADINVFQTNYLGRGLVRNPTDRDLRGEIDELRVWNHRRTTSQIRENMLKRLTGNEKGLVLLCNFDDGTANDSSPSAHYGKLVGNAKVAVTDLAFPGESTAPAVAPAPGTNAAVVTAAALPDGNFSAAAWMIAGALFIIVALLAWLAVMLKRSVLDGLKPLPTAATTALPPASVTAPTAVPSSVSDPVKERALAELTEFAKQSLVQGLYSQREALLAAHQKAQEELAAIEARVVALHLPDRIQAYEKRIAELESELATRSDEVRELTRATLHVLRQKLEEEKQAVQKRHSFN